MPAMYVTLNKLEKPKKDELAAKLYEAATSVLKVPHIYTAMQEHETLYDNGVPTTDSKMVLCNLEAGGLSPEKFELLAGNLFAAVQTVLGDSYKMAFIHHANDINHIAMNGKPLSVLLKK